MINLDEKKPFEQRDREFAIFALDTAYQNLEPLGLQMHLFEGFEITQTERNKVIMESDYGRDEKLVSSLLLFG